MSSTASNSKLWSTPNPKSHRSKNKNKIPAADINIESSTEFIKYEDVNRVAIISRIVVLCLQILALELIPVHNNDGFKLKLEKTNNLPLDSLIDSFFGGFTNWDGQYFMHIAMNGYTEQNMMAFFPLFPAIVGIFSKLCYIVVFPIMSFSSTLIVVSYFVNVYFFVETAKTLHRMVSYYDRGLQNLSTTAVLLFCYNPASIFFSAFYSESLFALLTFKVLLALYEKKPHHALVYASLSTVCRSNGILNLGLCFAFSLKYILRIEAKGKGCDPYEPYKVILAQLKYIVFEIFKCIICLLPFAIFQIFCHVRFCNSEYIYPAKIPSFCTGAQLPYQYIQSENWNVGFLKYFTVKQLPNFFLAAPVLFTLGYHCFPRFLKYVACVFKEHNFSCIPSAAQSAHGVFLTAFCFTCMHVQVSTRLILSSCPYLYVYIAKSLRTDIYELRSGSNNCFKYSLWIYAWFLLYFIVGALAFPTGYPWT